MPINRTDLDARLRLAGAGHTVKGSLFRTVCLELQRLLPASAGRDALVDEHLKAPWQEFSNYPVAEYLKLVYGSAELLEARAGSYDDALSLLGFRVGDAFLKSVVGRLAVMMASGKTPLDILSYAPAVYAPTANYGKRTFVRLGPDRAVFQVREDFLPPQYHLGAVRCGVGINGHAPNVELKPLGLMDCDVVVTWRADMESRPTG